MSCPQIFTSPIKRNSMNQSIKFKKKKKMAGEGEVVLLNFWASSFAMRAKIALAEKGVEYVCKEENFAKKSALFLEMNPVHKMIPVLIHNGKPICESLIIVEYIDEIWSHPSPLLPSDPYLRSKARFWGNFIDNKIYACAKKLWKAKGEEQDNLQKEFIESLKLLEEQLNDKLFFGGDKFGYVDVALVPLTCWFYAFEICGNFSIEAHCPKIIAWAKRCQERESVSKTLPDPHKIYDFVLDLKRNLGLD